eukprot:m.324043 g.324043  ORF g.324043 m.324043 type:complete len:483 (+) comp16540_c7_seq2:247-1695(+)
MGKKSKLAKGGGDGGDKGARWWEALEEPQTVWRACVTDDGLDFYVNTETNETTWDKPEELMTDEERKTAGEWLWVPDDENVYVPARKTGESGKKLRVVRQDGGDVTVPKDDCFPLKKTSLKRVVEDLTLLDDMSAPLILNNLKSRFLQSEIYTNIGNILVSVNPYQRLDIYSPEMVKKYVKCPPGKILPPHVFNVAQDAFYGVTAFGKFQSIVISGESGAGKTEATKQCLQYIAGVASSISGVENKILMANPILEAFGNAKTLRNDNSSRFGKYMEIFFSTENKIDGCSIRNYLLEKVRVSNPAPGERNFHIFYQLCKACPKAMRDKLNLLVQPAGYNYLATCTDVPTLDDNKDFADVSSAFTDLGIKDDEILGLYSIVGAILAMGNIQFKESKPDTAALTKDTMKHLKTAATLLDVTPEALTTALTTREIRIMGQDSTTAVLDPKQASDSRHALCKYVYGTMFDWLVVRINKAFPESRMMI